MCLKGHLLLWEFCKEVKHTHTHTHTQKKKKTVRKLDKKQIAIFSCKNKKIRTVIRRLYLLVLALIKQDEKIVNIYVCYLVVKKC